MEAKDVVKIKIVELQRNLQEERDRCDLLQSQSDFAKLAASQEIEKYKRECLCLRETVARLNDDYTTAREREQRDRETIKGLMEEMECKEREFAVMFVELKTEIRDLDRGRKRARDEIEEWKVKCSQLEAQLSKLLHETAQVSFAKSSQEHACEVDDELPKRAKKSSCEDLMSSPEPSRKNPLLVVLDSDSDDEAKDWINAGSQLSKKRLRDAGCLSSDTPSRECSVTGANITPVEATHVQTPLLSANDAEERNRSSGSKKKFTPSDLICSSTARSRGSTRCNSVSNKGAQAYHKRNFNNRTSKRTYVGRVPSCGQLKQAEKRAEELRSKLRPCNPSFVKPMLWSHVCGRFWLSLPKNFCNKKLPTCELKIILEDENGVEHAVNYIGHRYALSGGWKDFALDHNLELGDALIFELREPTRFKVYIIKAIPEESCEDSDNRTPKEEIHGTDSWVSLDSTEDQDVDLCDVW